MVTRASKKPRVVDQEEPKEKKIRFDAASFYSDSMDVISKRQNFESSSLDVAPPMSTGLLQIDMVYGGGIRASMITAAADEQAAKTTLALATMAAAEGIVLSPLLFPFFITYYKSGLKQA